MLFNNIEELEKIVLDLPDAQEQPVFVVKPDKTAYHTSEWKAIWNNQKESLACIASKEYAILQHKDAFLPVVDALKYMKLRVNGDLITTKTENRVYLNILFSDEKIVPSDGQSILLGLRAKNSYDRSNRFSISGYAYRQVCANGMMGFGLLETPVQHIHKGKVYSIAMESVVRLAVNILEAKPVMSSRIEASIKDFVNISAIEKICEEIGIGKRTFAKIKANIPGQASRWDAYNAITNYISNEFTGAEETKELYHNKALQVLAH